MVTASVAARRPVADRVPRRVTILGATGSIGKSTLDVIAGSGGAYMVEAVTANTDAARLAEVAITTRARVAVVADPSAFRALCDALAGTGIEAAAGPAAVIEAATRPVDVVVAAIVGSAGIAPTHAALAAGSRVALANKECLVSAGELFVRTARLADAPILPIDSEHNAVFQILEGRPRGDVARICLTASGGPFREWSRGDMAAASPAKALIHPRWSMGRKVTVDSATLMNKGLELIEAHHLFGVGGRRLDVLIHPESIVHALVTFHDGGVLASLGVPTMRVPIAHCLAWPQGERTQGQAFDLSALGTLTFGPPDDARFPALSVARAALDAGGWATNILSAANEIAVEAFLSGRLGFLQIVETVEETVARAAADHANAAVDSVDAAMALDRAGRRIASEIIRARAN